MSEKRPTLDRLVRKEDGSGNLAAGIGSLLAIGAFGVLFGELQKSERKAQASTLKPGAIVRVLEQGTADVSLGHGRTEHIVNPVVTKEGLVLGRDKESGKVKVYFGNKYANDDVGYKSHDIKFTEGSKPVSYGDAIKDAHPEEVAKEAGNIYISVGSHEPVAEASVIER